MYINLVVQRIHLTYSVPCIHVKISQKQAKRTQVSCDSETRSAGTCVVLKVLSFSPFFDSVFTFFFCLSLFCLFLYLSLSSSSTFLFYCFLSLTYVPFLVTTISSPPNSLGLFVF